MVKLSPPKNVKVEFNKNKLSFVFKWDAADFGDDIEYSISIFVLNVAANLEEKIVGFTGDTKFVLNLDSYLKFGGLFGGRREVPHKGDQVRFILKAVPKAGSKSELSDMEEIFFDFKDDIEVS